MVSQLGDRFAKRFSVRWQGQWPRLCLHCYHRVPSQSGARSRSRRSSEVGKCDRSRDEEPSPSVTSTSSQLCCVVYRCRIQRQGEASNWNRVTASFVEWPSGQSVQEKSGKRKCREATRSGLGCADRCQELSSTPKGARRWLLRNKERL